MALRQKSTPAVNPQSDALMTYILNAVNAFAAHCSEQRLEQYDTSLLANYVKTSLHARVRASEQVATMKRGPAKFIHQLADDCIEVAEPILIYSQIITDEALTDIIERHGTQHQIAIAKRQPLSVRICDILLEKNHSEVLSELAANLHAKISATGLAVLNTLAEDDVDIKTALEHRNGEQKSAKVAKAAAADKAKDASKKVAQPKAASGTANKQTEKKASAAVQLQPINNGKPAHAAKDKPKAAAEAPPAAKKPSAPNLGKGDLLSKYDFKTVANQLLSSIDPKTISQKHIVYYAERDQFEHVVVFTSRITKLPMNVIAQWMCDVNVMPMVCACVSSKIKSDTFQAMLSCGPWNNLLNSKMRRKALEMHSHMTQKEAIAYISRLLSESYSNE